ncbi:hypothetical protein KHQ82_00150 [Mycoplasmatota bacterium]|nr:hypothetical protein KHQ82_00150 [Mycoplasmatota bacterium]
MKKVENYLTSVKEHLPLIGRESIVMELRSFLLDEIEEKFGESPTGSEIEEFLKVYGDPEEVAEKYYSERHIIPATYTKLYMLVVKFIVFAVFIAFTASFFVKLLSSDLRDSQIFTEVLSIFANTLTASISGIGFFTVLLIVYSKFKKVIPEEAGLKKVTKSKTGSHKYSKDHSLVEVIISIIGSIAILVIINFFPELITKGEDLFINAGLKLGHRVNIEFINKYVLVFNFFWSVSIILEMVYFINRKKASFKLAYEGLSHTLHLALGLVLLQSSALYLDYTGLIGVKLVFLISVIVNSFELFGFVLKYVFKRLEMLN